MKNRLEELWKAAEDGASVPLGPWMIQTGSEIELIMDAWFRERHTSIELEILLSQSRAMIARLLSGEIDRTKSRRSARRLLRKIDTMIRSGNSTDD
ncbi:hypothetical protein P12x_000876 [Tundrisphaera lichenicola]|uniref:hypothetical protein n=1 Tax=Tundrisphaera lichenicola TaxID=2029860 RepID=UPI003EC0E299